MRRSAWSAVAVAMMLSACAVAPPAPPRGPAAAAASRSKAAEVVLFSLGLIDSGYRFGGRNPEAGLDCSGLVTYVYGQTLRLALPHDAARIARIARPIGREALQPGDLVFFNTLDRPFSHVGIYLGDERFIHAPSSRGRVRIDSLRSRYFASRFEAARSLFAD